MKSFLITILIFLSFSVVAQSDEIVGTWNFEGIYQQELLKDKELKSMTTLYSDVTLYIKEGGNYISVAASKVEEGTWEFDSTNKILKLTAVNGKSHEFEVIELKSDVLVVVFHKTSLILTKQK
jgi:hypothetical protein